MNMLRVWGGGIYENDVFYDLCDEHGIMIWQDFMFACSMYPAEGALLDNIHQEAVDNVKRLRNHACIALWCGNNECQDAWLGWGWKCEIERQNKEYADKIWAQYRQQYHVTLPGVVREYAPEPSIGLLLRSHSRERCPVLLTGTVTIGVSGMVKHPFPIMTARNPAFQRVRLSVFPEFDSVQALCSLPEDWDTTFRGDDVPSAWWRPCQRAD